MYKEMLEILIKEIQDELDTIQDHATLPLKARIERALKAFKTDMITKEQEKEKYNQALLKGAKIIFKNW